MFKTESKMLLLCDSNFGSEEKRFNDFQNFVNPDSSIILVDNFGICYLVIALPSSTTPKIHTQHHTKNHLLQCAPCCTPSEDLSLLPTNHQMKNERNERLEAVEGKEAKIEHDKKIIEEAISNRKSSLEKDAEKEAEEIFKQRFKENKTLEEAIDESLRDHIEMCVKAHALRLQFEHEKSLWMTKIRQGVRDNAIASRHSSSGSGYSQSWGQDRPYFNSQIPEASDNQLDVRVKKQKPSCEGLDQHYENDDSSFTYDLSEDILIANEGEGPFLEGVAKAEGNSKKRLQPFSNQSMEPERVYSYKKKFSTPSRPAEILLAGDGIGKIDEAGVSYEPKSSTVSSTSTTDGNTLISLNPSDMMSVLQQQQLCDGKQRFSNIVTLVQQQQQQQGEFDSAAIVQESQKMAYEYNDPAMITSADGFAYSQQHEEKLQELAQLHEMQCQKEELRLLQQEQHPSFYLQLKPSDSTQDWDTNVDLSEAFSEEENSRKSTNNEKEADLKLAMFIESAMQSA